MTLKEKMQQTREGNTVSDDELQQVFEKVEKIFADMQVRNIDKSVYTVEATWEENKLKVATQESKKSEIFVTEEIKSKKKQFVLQELLEEKLKQEGIEITGNAGTVYWRVSLI